MQNIGLILYLTVGNILFGVLYLLVLPIGKLCALGRKLVDKMRSYLYFNGLIRFFLEIFFDVAFVASINLQIAD